MEENAREAQEGMATFIPIEHGAGRVLSVSMVCAQMLSNMDELAYPMLDISDRNNLRVFVHCCAISNNSWSWTQRYRARDEPVRLKDSSLWPERGGHTLKKRRTHEVERPEQRERVPSLAPIQEPVLPDCARILPSGSDVTLALP